MKRKIITTADGSKTIQIEDWNEQYHSIHGAVAEARHVFLKHGLDFYCESCRRSSRPSEPSRISDDIRILEIGFGTGLNAFLSLVWADQHKIAIDYVGVEAYPVEWTELEQLNYSDYTGGKFSNDFKTLHKVDWGKQQHITSYFKLEKQQKFFKDIKANEEFDVVYFDAFGARVQPELWTEDMFRLMYQLLNPKGVLVTYAAKGSVRRAMQSVGFNTDRLPGPPGKREMLRATKPD